MMLPNKELLNVASIAYPNYVQPYYGGLRVAITNTTNTVKFITEHNLEFSGSRLLTYFNIFENIQSYVFFGELYSKSHSKDQILDLLKTNKELPKDLKLYLYDTITTTDWLTKHNKEPYFERLANLRKFITGVINEPTKILDIETYKCESSTEAVGIYKLFLSRKLEGMYLRNPYTNYTWGRVSKNDRDFSIIKRQEVT